MPPVSIFPTLHSCAKITRSDDREENVLFDVKFYPYPTEDDDPIFAAVGGIDVFICRPLLGAEQPLELLRWWKHDGPNTSINSVTWAKEPRTLKPNLCIAGASPRNIIILDVEAGVPARELSGHGKSVNDLAVSPTHHHILASASEDHTIRLWNLDPDYAAQPCVAIFAGEGHHLPLIAASFHPNGRWLISGGFETDVCVWAVPSAEQLVRHEKEQQQQHGHIAQPLVVYYPMFRSTEVHHNYVDTLFFYGDLILSRAAHNSGVKDNVILLWRIEGFDSNAPPPTDPPVPEPGVFTRSAFVPNDEPLKFRRLLTFSTPYSDRFYHRFALLHQPGMRPILCMGNQLSRFFFWDLQRLEEGIDPADEFKSKGHRKKGKSVKPVSFLESLQSDVSTRHESVSSRSLNDASVDHEGSASASPAPERKMCLGDPFTPLAAHHSVLASTSLSSSKYFATSNLSWSPDGTWLVGVGDDSMVCVFHRDKSVVNGVAKTTTQSPD